MKTLKIPFIALLSSADYKTGRLSAVSIGSTTYGIIDNLTIAREGNKLKSVSDVALSPLVTNPTNFTDGATNTQEYAYDGRGNLTRDDNKGITSITYNPLNLPSVVTFSTGATIQYLYRSDGVKLRTIHTPSSGTATTTNYCSNLVYDGTTLKMMLFDGGYATMSGSFPTYHYYLRDHLGSNRVLVNADGTVEQLIHYYPYGGEWSDATGSDIQPYKYTGKELDKTFSLNLYDYGARHYDPSLCSWTGQDPLGDKYYGMSSYGFCGGNPVKFIDSDGRIVRLANSYAGGIENIARIAATSLGSRVMSHLIRQKDVYTLNSTFWTASSSYNPKSRDINYVGNPWYKEIPFDGGALNSMVAMGHETFHAFDHSNYVFNSADIVEPRAVSFVNYLRQAYSLSPLREQYGNIKGNFHLFTGNEEISNFTTLGNNSDKTSYGFSYTKTTTIVESYKTFLGIKTPDKTRTETAIYYMTVSKDKNNNVSFQTFSNEESYKKATSNW